MAGGGSVEVKRVQSAAGKRFEIAIAHLKDKQVKIGWFEGQKYDDEHSTPIAAVAAQNEFGNPNQNIPARPFMRPTIAQQENNWRKISKDGAKEVIEGKRLIDTVFELIGRKAVGDIKTTITKIYDPPLSQATINARIEREGHSGKFTKRQALTATKPLVDTAEMVNTIISVIEDA